MANIKLATTLSGDKVMAVVKADAYGLGIAGIVKSIYDLDECRYFAVAFSTEGEYLRKHLTALGSLKDIITLEGFFNPEDLDLHLQYKLIPTIHSPEQIEMLKKHKITKPLGVWIKYNSAMNRLGLNAKQLKTACEWLAGRKDIRIEGIMTHFASANRTELQTTIKQVEDFSAGLCAIEDIIVKMPRLPLLSLCNSPGIMAGFGSDPFAQLQVKPWMLKANYVSRPGLMLYGASPMDEKSAQELGIKTVACLTTELIAVRRLLKGDAVGYEEGWRAPRDCLMGVAPIGYADGYPFVEPSRVTKMPVIVKGKRCYLGGRVSMDMLCLDLDGCPDAKVGDKVELWGDNLSSNEVAQITVCPPQRLYSSITSRVPRVYE